MTILATKLVINDKINYVQLIATVLGSVAFIMIYQRDIFRGSKPDLCKLLENKDSLDKTSSTFEILNFTMQHNTRNATLDFNTQNSTLLKEGQNDTIALEATVLNVSESTIATWLPNVTESTISNLETGTSAWSSGLVDLVIGFSLAVMCGVLNTSK